MKNHTETRTPGSASPKPRPPLLRALGTAEPPEVIDVDGHRFTRLSVLKHDAWAATALYGHRDVKIVCKFNRSYPVFGIPFSWIGSRLAAREGRFLRILADDPHVPDPCGPVYVDGREVRNAVAHSYIPGRTLWETDSPGREFVRGLEELIERLKHSGIVYVDLHKLDNILVGDDRKPYLIDFQISLLLPRVWPWTWLLQYLHQLDRYHLLKHISRLRPDLCSRDDLEWVERRPRLINVHRWFAEPLRQRRRSLLVRMGVRTGAGESFTEHPPGEHTKYHQPTIEHASSAPPSRTSLRADFN